MYEAEIPPDLAKRFVLYWEARNRQEAQKAWEFERPSWRKLYDLKRYRIYLSIVNKAPLLQLRVEKARCQEKMCCLILTGVFDTPRGKEEWRWEDCWVKEGGVWYHQIRDSFFFPEVRPKRL